MNTNAVQEVSVAPQSAAEIPVARRFYWLVWREILEYRAIYLAPLATAALILVGFAIRLAHYPDTLRSAAALDAMHQHAAIEQPYTFAALLLMFSTILVAMFYGLDALYGERRDRSILFWKSLPVSDLATVLAKASIPIFVIPLLTFAVTFITQVIMLLLAAARLQGTGLSVWSHLSFPEMTWVLFHHLVVGHGLWYAPIWAWLLLCSAWARRAPYLWATLPLLAAALVENIAFNTAHFAGWLGHRFWGGPLGQPHSHSPMTIAELTPATPIQFLASPGLWFGLALAAAFLAAAVRLRRYRGPI